jgi:hypothetical protein
MGSSGSCPHTYRSVLSKELQHKVSSYSRECRDTDLPLTCLYASELYIDMEEKVIYTNTNPGQSSQWRDILGLGGYRVEPADRYIFSVIAHNNLQSNPSDKAGGKAGGDKKKKSAHTFRGGVVHKTGGSRSTFWVYPNPHTSPDSITMASVLGPKITNIANSTTDSPSPCPYQHCIQLPYFKFRSMTKPFHEHQGQCDRPGIVNKKLGVAKDSLLLTGMIAPSADVTMYE